MESNSCLDEEEPPELLSNISGCSLMEQSSIFDLESCYHSSIMIDKPQSTLSSFETKLNSSPEYLDNFFSILFSFVNRIMKDNPDYKIDKHFVNIFSEACQSINIYAILNKFKPNYIEENREKIHELLAKPSDYRELFFNFFQLLFPSLVGSYEIKYSNEKYNSALEWIAKEVEHYSIKQQQLKELKEQKEEAVQNLIQVAKNACKIEYLKSIELLIKEKKTRKAIIKAQLDYENTKSTAKCEKSICSNEASDTIYHRIVLENDQLENELSYYEGIKHRIDQLPECNFNLFQNVYKEKQFLLKVISNQTPNSTSEQSQSCSLKNFQESSRLSFSLEDTSDRPFFSRK